MEDPQRLTFQDWATTGSMLHYIWFFVICVVAFASFMLLAHAILPSALNSGHVPEGLRNFVRKQRLPMYLTALAILGLIAFWFSRLTPLGHDIARFYDRFWF